MRLLGESEPKRSALGHTITLKGNGANVVASKRNSNEEWLLSIAKGSHNDANEPHWQYEGEPR